MKITPEMFGLTKEEVAKFEKQDERLAKFKQVVDKLNDEFAKLTAQEQLNDRKVSDLR